MACQHQLFYSALIHPLEFHWKVYLPKTHLCSKSCDPIKKKTNKQKSLQCLKIWSKPLSTHRVHSLFITFVKINMFHAFPSLCIFPSITSVWNNVSSIFTFIKILHVFQGLANEWCFIFYSSLKYRGKFHQNHACINLSF